jgi:short-subunit dehydrogenase
MRKNIIITGASSGLGYGMAQIFAAKGHNLGLCARRLDKLQEIKETLVQQYPHIDVKVLPLDVNEHEQVFEVFQQFKQHLGSIDRVIVNAGMGKGASIGTGHFHANRQTALTNFVSALAQCEAAMEIFRAQAFGHLVTISSVSAVRGFRRAMTVYAATKAGLTSLTEGIRLDVANTLIKVSCIHPGFIKTPLNESVKNAPFQVDLVTGCKALVKAIDKEKANSYVPFWPWAILYPLLKIAPDRLIRKLS